MFLRAKAPLRISFAGGGTDVAPYAEEQGGAVLNATIDKHAYATLETREDARFHIYDLDDEAELAGEITDNLDYDGNHDMAKAVIKRMGVKQGFNLHFHSDAPWGSGLGSSSTHIVAVLGAFSYWLRLGLAEYELAEMAYHLERIDIGMQGGRQDQYSATFGGFNFIEFGPGGVVVNPLSIKPDILHELHYRLLLCFFGRTRASPQILADQINRYKSGEEDSIASLHKTKELAYEMKRALLKGEIDLMGELLHEGWEQKRRFSNLISNSYIDGLYEEARHQGAIGGKVLGAGGGGHMLFLCSPEGKRRLANYLRSENVEVVSFTFEPNGLTVWEVADVS